MLGGGGGSSRESHTQGTCHPSQTHTHTLCRGHRARPERNSREGEEDSVPPSGMQSGGGGGTDFVLCCPRSACRIRVGRDPQGLLLHPPGQRSQPPSSHPQVTPVHARRVASHDPPKATEAALLSGGRLASASRHLEEDSPPLHKEEPSFFQRKPPSLSGSSS